MTMLSVRFDDEDLEDLDRVAKSLGRDRSDVVREALRRQLAAISAELDAQAYERQPFTEEELALCAVDDWGPAEDWSDWADATR